MKSQSFPRRKDKFVAWSKAMVEGSTVDKPNYPGSRGSQTNRKQRRKRRKNSRAKKD